MKTPETILAAMHWLREWWTRSKSEMEDQAMRIFVCGMLFTGAVILAVLIFIY